MAKQKSEKVEIGFDEEPEIPKEKKETPKNTIEPKALEYKKFSEFTFGDLYMKIPNDLESVSRARRILRIFEEDLLLEKNGTERILVVTDKKVEEVTLPEIPEVPEQMPLQEQEEVKVQPSESYSFCPICNGKLKKTRLKKSGSELKQTVKCKNRKCNFKREYTFGL